MNIITISEITDNGDLWAVDEFLNAYQAEAKDNLVACALAVAGGESGDANETALAVLRVAIEKSDRALTDQKFVVGISFYGFGDMMTIDVVSLDEEYHRDAIYEHAKRLNYIMPNSPALDRYGLSYHIPFIYGGAHLRIKDGSVETFGSSGDYGTAIFSSNATAIADYAIATCSLPSSANVTAGESFIKSLLEFMIVNKLKPDFYEELVGRQILNGAILTGQQFGGLLAMKASDRVKNGEGDLLQMLVEELTGGFTQRCLVYQVAARMQSHH